MPRRDGGATSGAMKAAEADLLFAPDLDGASPDHWQSRWRQRLSTARFALPPGPRNDDPAADRARLLAAVGAATRPILFIAHGAGVGLIARAAAELATAGPRVAGAFLVAPRAGAADDPLPDAPLPFPSLLVASRSDPRCDFDAAADLALAWGSALVDAGAVGGIDAASGHGPWPEGLMRLGAFLARL